MSEMTETFDAYIEASRRARKTLGDYRFGEATEGQVATAARAEAEAEAAHRQALAEATR